VPPTSDILQRVFCIRAQNTLGSAFAVPIGEKIAFVTAKHVVANLPENQNSIISLFDGLRFDDISVRPHFCSNAAVDIAVLETSLQGSASVGLPLSSAGLAVGQDSYFLGFPYFGTQITYQPQMINSGYPLPLVKTAAYSGGFEFIYYLDGHNNPGFSGGPVVFPVLGEGAAVQKICAVISGYLGHQGQIVHIPTAEDLAYVENSGIIVAYKIEEAVKVIEDVYGKPPNANLRT
jgi:S1-C subfamily serine protease